MMMIKNSGYVPNPVSSPYLGKKVEQAASVQNKSNAAKLDKISGQKKMDTIEISNHPVSNRPSLSQIRDNVISDLNQDKDVSFLETLKSQINSNQYKIDSKELSKIMLTGEKD